MMYDELVKKLRYCGNAISCLNCPYWEGCGGSKEDLTQAADAIEELSEQLENETEYATALNSYMPQWIPIESRPMTEEERKEWSERIGYDIEYENAISYTSKLPDDGEEVLVCNKYGHIWIDTFDNDPDYGVGFETNGDMDGIVAWMPKPKPYKPPKEEIC